MNLHASILMSALVVMTSGAAVPPSDVGPQLKLDATERAPRATSNPSKDARATLPWHFLRWVQGADRPVIRSPKRRPDPGDGAGSGDPECPSC